MFKGWNKFRERLSFSSTAFILGITAYFAFVLNISFWRFVFRTVEVDSFGAVIFIISVPVVMFVLLYIIFNLIVVPYIAKPVLIFFLIGSSIANYLMSSYGIFIDSDMIRNAFETNTREALDLVTFPGIMQVFLTGIVPAGIVLFSTISFKPFKRELFSRGLHVLAGLGIVCCFAATSYKEYAAYGRNNREVRKLVNTVNYVYATVRYFQRQAAARRQFVTLDEQVKIVPFPDNHKTVLVFVLGETARAANFSLYGYDRQTNPLLSKQDIAAFRDVASCGTATAVSVPCMFSHLARSDFDVADAKYTENLLDLLKRGGYDILWLENDNGCKGVCDRVEVKDMIRLNNPKYCFKDYCHDEVMLEELKNKLDHITTDTVIVLHTMGSHGPTYFNRYPERFRVFKPTCDTADIQNCSREAILNTYDNTIVYTDYIVNQAIELLKQYPDYESGLVYVSDHGESLGENNIYLHGFPYQIAPKEQKEVPMIMWMSDVMKKEDHIDYQCLKKEAEQKSYAHDHLFHSLLGLLEVSSHTYRPEFDLFHACRTKDLPF